MIILDVGHFQHISIMHKMHKMLLFILLPFSELVVNSADYKKDEFVHFSRFLKRETLLLPLLPIHDMRSGLPRQYFESYQLKFSKEYKNKFRYCTEYFKL